MLPPWFETAATEALRLAHESLKAGYALLDHVLPAEDALNLVRQHYTAGVVVYDKAQVNLLVAVGILDRSRWVPVPADRGLRGAGIPCMLKPDRDCPIA